MAAILCHGVHQMCGTGCKKLGSLPCCAAEDNEEEDASGTCRGYCGNCCGCGRYLNALQHICTNPFGIFVTVTVVSNIPPIIIALTEVGNIHSGAGAPVCFASLWLLVNSFFCLVHIIASFYIVISINYHRIQQQAQKNNSNNMNKQNNKGMLTLASSINLNSSPDRTIFRRASNLFCYDPGLAIYIMAVCVYVGFVFVPHLFHLDDPNNESNLDGTCDLYIHEKVVATVGFAGAFLGFGLGALGLSFGFAYVDSTRKTKSSKLPSSRFDQDPHEVSETDGSVYTNMEEGNQTNDGSGSGSGSGENNIVILNNNNLKKHTRSKGRRDQQGSSPFSTNVEHYVPPMINYDDDNNNHHDKGIELGEAKRNNRKSIRVDDTLHNVMMTSDDDGTDTAGFATDELDTDLETDIEGRTSLDTADDHYPNHRRPKVTVSYFEDEDDNQPVTSYEVQETEESSSETYMGGGETTDGAQTDYGGHTTSFGEGSTDIDRAIDFTDTEAAAFNLDRVMAVSQDEPTVSMSFDPLEASGDDTGSVTGSIGESIASLVNSITGSIGGSTAGGGSTNNSSGMRTGKPSFRNTPLAKRDLGQYAISRSTPNNRLVGSSSLQNKNPREASKKKAGSRDSPLLASSAVGPYDSPRRADHSSEVAADINLEQYYSYNDPPLTYSTSIGTMVGPAEPLSFVDGGGVSNDGGNQAMNINAYDITPRNIRYATTQNEKKSKRKRSDDAPKSNHK